MITKKIYKLTSFTSLFLSLQISALITSSHLTFYSHEQLPTRIRLLSNFQISPTIYYFSIADSNLQTFPPSGTQGKISSVFCPLQDADGSNVAMVVVDTFSRPGKGAKTSSDESSQATGWFSMFSVAAYKPYFDVDTTNVLERTEDSLFPFRRSFNEKTTNNPDLNSQPKINRKCHLYNYINQQTTTKTVAASKKTIAAEPQQEKLCRLPANTCQHRDTCRIFGSPNVTRVSSDLVSRDFIIHTMPL
ncbi:protein YIPF1 isoform X1 [Carex littledalei]|uniref:Protein YIPF1 isoform X1 n=1 Tax=Carex littledalei TaxID=544730 RepID=A0A833VF70_9POAL|nr:protein YIPF1 isoform X1 [Carex littledalei]